MGLFQRIRNLTRRKSLDADIEAELRAHLEMAAEDEIRAGRSASEARRIARLRFGNPVALRERTTAADTALGLDALWRDVRFSLRQILKSPGVSAAAVLTLVLGISANTAIFTLTWNIILSSLPVPHPDRLVEYEMRKGAMAIGLSGPEYRALSQRQKSSTALLAWAGDSQPVRAAGVTRRRAIELLSRNAASLLEIRPALGRFFLPPQPNGQSVAPEALLSYRFWRSHYGGRSDALGAQIFVGGHPATVVGVMPRGFAGLTANARPAVYLPLSFGRLLYGQDYLTSPGRLGFYVMGRLRPGVSLAAAKAETRAIQPAVRKAADPSGVYLGQFFRDFNLEAHGGYGGVSWVRMTYERPLLVLELLTAFVLLLCCVNTALVMMARVSGRQQEYALRSALGAGRRRLIRQVLVETGLLTIPGLVGGVLLGWLGAHLLVELLGPRGTPSAMDLRPNAAILAVNIGAALLVALGAGLWPALRAARNDPAMDLKSASRSTTARHLGGWAVALQVAVSLSLVSAAVLLGGTLTRLLTEHSGFNPRNAVVADLHLGALRLKAVDETALTDRLLRAVQAKPGVTAAGYIAEPPMAGAFGVSSMFSVDRNRVLHSAPNVFYIQATPGYFPAAGTRIVAGQADASPAHGLARCVLSESMARFFFPHANAVGELVYYSTTGKPDGAVMNTNDACQVTGIAENARFVSLREAPPMMVYAVQSPAIAAKFRQSWSTLIVRGESEALAAVAVREAAQSVLPSQADVTLTGLQQLRNQSLSSELMLVSLSGTFAVMALLLTALGLYGVLMRALALRRREIGIRIALGARPGGIAASLARRTMLEVAIGAMAGIALALLAEKLVRQLLRMPPVGGLAEIVASVAVVVAVAALATFAPVRRAANVDPIRELRAD